MNKTTQALRTFVECIHDVGGIYRDEDGNPYPACDPDWIDLGMAYEEAVDALKSESAGGYTELETKLIHTLQALTDGNYHYWQEVQADTGLPEARCQELLETIKWVNSIHVP